MAENSSAMDISIPEENQRNISPRLIVQGGAYSSGLSVHKVEFMKGIKQAAKEGYAVLQNGRAIDAVEAAVRILEDNKHFNAGHGSFLNNNGEVECDAMIMDGKTLDTGAVIAVRHFKNPVSLSKKVMEKTDHCALCADGALEFARRNHLPILNDPNDLVADTSLNIKNKDFVGFVNFHYKGELVQEVNDDTMPADDLNAKLPCAASADLCHDTVSAVALDIYGNFACATSSGGIPGKLKGRVGDVPMIGCGGYANENGAATATGHGEQIMKMTLAREVVYNMEKRLDAQTSSVNALKKMQTRVNGYGGVIAIDRCGNFGKYFNTDVMIWATVKDNTLEYGLKNDEFETEQLL